MAHNGIYLPLSVAVKNKWTEDEKKYLLLHHKDMFIEDIAAELGRAITATKSKAFRMGCSIKSKPTEGDNNE